MDSQFFEQERSGKIEVFKGVVAVAVYGVVVVVVGQCVHKVNQV